MPGLASFIPYLLHVCFTRRPKKKRAITKILQIYPGKELSHEQDDVLFLCAGGERHRRSPPSAPPPLSGQPRGQNGAAIVERVHSSMAAPLLLLLGQTFILLQRARIGDESGTSLFDMELWRQNVHSRTLYRLWNGEENLCGEGTLAGRPAYYSL